MRASRRSQRQIPITKDVGQWTRNTCSSDRGSVSTRTVKASNNLIAGLALRQSLNPILYLWTAAGSSLSSSACVLRYPDRSSGLITYFGVSAGNWSETSGVTFSGTPTDSGYARTDFVPSSFMRSTAEGSAFCYMHTSTGTDRPIVGANNSSSQAFNFFPRYSDGNCYWRSFNETNGSGSLSVACAPPGFVFGRRESSTSTVISLNGTQLASGSGSGGSLPSIAVWIHQLNNNGSIGITSGTNSSRQSLVGIGNGLSARQEAGIRTEYTKFAATIERSLP